MPDRITKFLRNVDPAAALLVALGLVLRVRAVPLRLGDLDAVNFARSLSAFDPFAQAPHFPGYPVLVLAARVAAALGAADPVWALVLPGLVAWPLAGLVLASGLRERAGRGLALAVLACASLAPGVVLHSAWPGSEGLGFALLCASVGALCSRSARLHAVGALGLGVLLGVRLSWWPVVLGLVLAVVIWERARAKRALALCAVGVCAWLVPMLVLLRDGGAGHASLASLARAFVYGHFHSWGASAFADGHASLAARALGVASSAWSAGLGAASLPMPAHVKLASPIAAWLLALLCGLSAILLASRARDVLRSRVVLVLAVLAVPYALWLVLAQNVDKSRHLLPLLPLAAALLALGLGPLSQRLRTLAFALACIASCGVSFARAGLQAEREVPALSLARFLPAAHAPSGLLVFAGEEARVLAWYAPEYRVLHAQDASVLAREARRAAQLGVEVWVTSTAAPSAALAQLPLTPLARFDYPAELRANVATLSLQRYRLDPPGAPSASDASLALRSSP